MNDEINFYSKTASFSSPLGASASCIRDSVFLIGGVELHATMPENPFLQVKSANIVSTEWIESFVDSKAILNRSFHASVSLKDSIYVFGGCVKTFTPQYKLSPSNEVIKLDTTSFGLKCMVVAVSNLTKKQGLTAVCVGKEKDKVILFGGCGFSATTDAPKQTCSSEVSIFQEKTNEISLVEIAAGDIPSPRAFHSCVTFGDVQQYLVIFGGQGDGNVFLGDLWMLDISEILEALDAPPPAAAAAIPDKKAKPPAKGKEKEVKGPSAYWTKLSSAAAPIPRYLHCSYGVISNDGSSVSVFIFGGITESGPAITNEIYSSIVTKGDQNKFSATPFNLLEKTSIEGKEAPKGKIAPNLTAYGMATVAIPDAVLRYAKLTSAYPGSNSDGLRTADLTDLAADSITTDAGPSSLQPSCVLVFGGKRAIAPGQPISSMTAKAIKQMDAETKRLENTSYFIALQPDSKLVRKILRNVKSLNRSVYEGEVAEIMVIQPSEEDITDDEAEVKGDDNSSVRSLTT
eukprot:gene27525-36218_t